jgi:transcriptional regulator with XRE-family HTH domain
MGSRRRPQPLRLPSKLLRIRESLDLSQEQMAKRLETERSPVYPTHISEFERGLREPSLLVLLQYARLVGVSTDVLIDDALDLPSKLRSILLGA